MHAVPLINGKPMPLVIHADEDEANREQALIDKIGANAAVLEDLVHRAGAVVLRGFPVSTVAGFRSVCATVSPDLRNYVGGDSPRHGLADQVYNATEYPSAEEVLLHNELSYAAWSPNRVYFGCLLPAQTGGETHIADGREIYRRLNADVRDRFENRGVTYLQHLWDADDAAGPGKSWQETFETTDRSTVENNLKASNTPYSWTELGIKTATTRPAVLKHTVTGQMCWHNQADQWHRDIASVKDFVSGRETTRTIDPTAGDETVGSHVTFGDGQEIDVADLQHVREVSRACEIKFPWQAGDIMILDNVLTLHGRKPFTGDRQVVVAMA